MNKSNSIEAIDRTDLSEQTKFRLDQISKIENYFHKEINQRKLCSKKLNKHVAVFDQALIVLSATSGGASIISFTIIVEAPVGIASVSKVIIFFSINRNSQNIIEYNKKKKENEW